MARTQWANFPELNPILLWEDDIPLWQDGMPAINDEIQDKPSITPYLLEDGAVHGAMIVFPGGGYAMKAMHEAEPIARMFNAVGMHAFVLNYRVSPFRHPAPLEDALRAIRYVRAHAAEFGVDPAHIGILGFSAGGHLAATAATMFDRASFLRDEDPVDEVSSRPDAAVLCYPVISMADGVTHNGSRANLTGIDAETEETLAMSAELAVTPMTPPAFIWHTADDNAVPIANSYRMAEALSANGVTLELHVFPHGPHGMGLAENDDVVGQWPALAVKFLKKLGF